MTLETYWDLDIRARGELTEQQVEDFVTIELAKQGVIRPRPMKLQEVPDVVMQKRQFFRLAADGRYGSNDTIELLFESADKALQAAALACGRIENDYSPNVDCCRPLTSVTVQAVMLPTTEERIDKQSLIKKKEAIDAANSKEQRRWDAECDAVKKASKGVWENWQSCKSFVALIQEIRDKFAEFTRIAKGDEHVALEFLRKAFPQDRLGVEFDHYFEEVTIEEALHGVATIQLPPDGKVEF